MCYNRQIVNSLAKNDGLSMCYKPTNFY